MLHGSCPPSFFEDKLFPQKYTLQIKGRLISLEKPKIMGIINLTPDSFFEKSRIKVSQEQVLTQARKMLEEGADFLDLGGYSSRPGAMEISVQEEVDRVSPAVRWIKNEFPEALISVDTFRGKVAQSAITEGADLINDISAGNLDSEILEVVAKSGLPYLAMHMKGNPKNMQKLTEYGSFLPEILYYFAEKVEIFKKLGIKDVIIDPGFGFAKTQVQNFELLRNLNSFRVFGLPLLVGVSRKSMIYKSLSISADEALNGTTALNMYSLINGANILRVHDVKEAKETIKLYEQLYP
ncbi:MAG: dihydropteroate synthase [Cyclobacteriaceae bacterium]|nr:dihydropteroate synthase [Cyclobacteriaceae bacterium]MDX5465763.1 dihydropteroate synthase [Cyclobacteriaceae bacterium]